MKHSSCWHAVTGLAGLFLAMSAAADPQPSCTDELREAHDLLGKGEDAARESRWVEALRRYGEAEVRLRALAGRACGADVAQRVSDALGDVDYDRGVARDDMPREFCETSLNNALGQDRRAATRQLEKAPWDEVASLFRTAETAWDDATVVCEGENREKAVSRRGEAARAREGAQALAAAAAQPVASRSSASEPATPPAPAPAPAFAPAPAPISTPLPAPTRVAAQGPAVAPTPLSAPLPEPTAANAGEPAASGPLPTDAPAKLLQRMGNFIVGAVERVSPAAATALRESGPSPGIETGGAIQPPAAASAKVTLRGPGVTYTGEFRRDAVGGTVSGTGRVEWANGNHFVGTLVGGKAEGAGTMIWADSGNRYEGAWHDDRQHGRGVMTFGDGSRYEGDFDSGRMTGKGRYRYGNSGDVYEGELMDGKPQGQGSYAWTNGDRYEGQWQAGMKSGLGRYLWANGDRWDGRYENDERTADGKMTFSAGAK